MSDGCVNEMYVDNHVVVGRTMFVFSCPGQRELVDNIVCAGETGRNLTKLIGIVRAMGDADIVERYFPSDYRYDYSILNASTKVHYKDATKDSEAKSSEIRASIQRFSMDVQRANPRLVILFGAKAQKAWLEGNKGKPLLGEDVPVIGADTKIPHLGARGLNSLRTRGEKETVEALLQRVAVVILSVLLKC